MFSEPINVAVTYWSDFLSSNDAPPRDNGDTENAMMNILLGMMAKNHTPTGVAKVEAFKFNLANNLETALNSDYPRVTLRVDYNPEGLLWDAIQAANIDSIRDAGPLPWKTTMWVSPEKVSVRQGYGADERVLWEKAKESAE